ncbi:DUF1194 domain-containing protein [Pararhizobium haloflavum]|uniref:DUF1194 domain-containing protein n=1 Tax=Pararhizobium haloflavum TaxID=2037914 RepID=UPI00130003A9|nr:DUF1194 domain-containing protein [Pararhizobium haloflavum]
MACWLAASAWSPVRAHDVRAVDLALVIAVDVSTSMDREERILQHEGFAGAFEDSSVIGAIAEGPHGRIAVTYFEWAGNTRQRLIMPWTIIDGAQSSENFAARLRQRIPGTMDGGTAIGTALLYGVGLLDAKPFFADRNVINLSGDGVNNRGADLDAARTAALSRGITINGLAIVYKDMMEGLVEVVEPVSPEVLIDYFDTEIIGGTGAFVEPVTALENYSQSIRRKILREIQDPRQLASR